MVLTLIETKKEGCLFDLTDDKMYVYIILITWIAGAKELKKLRTSFSMFFAVFDKKVVVLL